MIVKKWGVLGAGPSGLVMSMCLREEHDILERSLHVGGHASSFTDQGYTFDHGPHILFSKDKRVLDFIVRSLGENVHKLRRNNKVCYKNQLIKYPFENDLKALPLEDNFDCLYQFLENPFQQQYANPKNLREWLLKHFGQGICDKYLFPYNEKVWNISVDRLSMIWADRIPMPPKKDVIKGALGFETEGYLHQLFYFYPKRGGYQAISEVWANKSVPITYNYNITSIRQEPDRTFTVSNGKEVLKYEQIISTIPIHELIKMLDMQIPELVRNAISQLIVNPMFVISLGIQGEDKDQFTAVYFPEPEFLVNRISFPTTFSPYNAPKGHYSIQAEITCLANSDTWRMSDQEILQHTIDGLASRHLLDPKNITYMNVRRHQYAYVVYDTQYEKNTKIIREWFPQQGIHLLGRFSFFEYINIDGVVSRAIEIASKLNGSPVKIVDGALV